MAKVLNPLMSGAARGKVGGIIYNVWRGLATVKIHKSPAQPRTARQLAVRSYVTTLSRAWAGLTDSQRAAWTEWADSHPVSDWTGTNIRMTGMNAYIKTNSILLDMGQEPVANPPSAAGPTSVDGFACTGGEGQISVAFTPRTGSNETIDIWLQGPHSAGLIGTLSKARHISYNPGETSPIVLSDLSPGNYTVWARTVSEADGQVSSFVSDTVVVS